MEQEQKKHEPQGWFFRCKKCGSVMDEADLAFAQKQDKANVCPLCRIGRGNFFAYAHGKHDFRYLFFLFAAFCWLFPHLLWGELLYRTFMEPAFILQWAFSNISALGAQIGYAFDIVLMVSGGIAIFCASLFFTAWFNQNTNFGESALHVWMWWQLWDSGDGEDFLLHCLLCLWSIIRLLLICLLSAVGIIIYLIIIVIRFVHDHKRLLGAKLKRKERVLCSRYWRLLNRYGKKRCRGYYVYPSGEMHRRQENGESIRFTEGMKVDKEKYFIANENKGANKFKNDEPATIFELVRPYRNEIEIKELIMLPWDKKKYFLFVPYQDKISSKLNYKDYGYSDTEFADAKKLLRRHRRKIRNYNKR